MTQANGKESAIFGRGRTIIIPETGILFDWGTTVPSDGTEGYAPGCIFQDVDAAADANLYKNNGTKASSNFEAIGDSDISNRFSISATIDGTAAATATNYGKVFIAPRACTVTKISEVHTTAGSDGSAVTLHVERLQGTETSGNGDNLHTTGMNLKGTAETVQSPTLLTSGVATLAAGDRFNLVDTGTLTAVAGVCVTIELEWVVS